MSILAFLAILTIADHLVTGGFYTERTVQMIVAILN
jgi:hypothetical protein